jgi:hypothetical protein
MSKITMLADANGLVVRASQNDTTTGFIVLQSKKVQVRGRRAKTVKRSCYISGTLEDLQDLQQYWATEGITGKIVVREYVKSQVPDEFIIKDRETKLPDWSRMQAKRAGNEGPVLTLGGEPIYRFAIYDETGEMSDIIVEHDNSDAVKAHQAAAAAKAAKAALPSGRGRKATA